MKLHLKISAVWTGVCRGSYRSSCSLPAHRLHDVEKHGSRQIRAEVNEHGENYHCKAKSLLVVFLQHSCTVPTPDI